MLPAATRLLTISAALGFLVWIGLAIPGMAMRPADGMIDLLFILAPLAVVPLGLALLARGATGLPVLPGLRTAAIAVLPAALASAAAFHAPRGPLSAALTLPWLAITAWLALAGLRLLIGLRTPGTRQGTAIAALLYLPVGGAHLTMSRMGMTPLGFVEPIVLLTAVHFHFAGFAGPVFTAALGGRIRREVPSRRRLHAVSTAGVVFAPAILAAGWISGIVHLKLAAALFLAAGYAGAAWLTLASLTQIPRLAARVLLALSALSALAGMALGVLYALGESRESLILGIPVMAFSHGVLNGLGFCALGLAGWLAAGPAPREGEGGVA